MQKKSKKVRKKAEKREMGVVWELQLVEFTFPHSFAPVQFPS